MPAEPDLKIRAIETEMEAIYRLYLGFSRFMTGDGLGGKLLYAGESHAAGQRLLRAANIAGAASIAVSADAAALREAMRAGAIDFVVNSLDEALRILKNEIRKQQPVAVGVSLAPQVLLCEMIERGVQPNLIAPDAAALPEIDAFVACGAQRIEAQSLPSEPSFNIVPIPPDWNQPAAAFDELLLECIAPEDAINRRWVRYAPRYLPSEARRLRSLAANNETMRRLLIHIASAKPNR